MLVVLLVVALVDLILWLKNRKSKPDPGKIAVAYISDDSLDKINPFDNDGDNNPNTSIYKFDIKDDKNVIFVGAPL